MKKLLAFFAILIAGTAFFACSDDSEPVPAFGVDKGDSIAVADLITTFSFDENLGLKPDDIDTWKGVSFEFDAVEKKFRVVKISLEYGSQKNGLPIPATIANLTHLRELKLLIKDCNKPILNNSLFDLPLESLWIVGWYLESWDVNFEPDKENGVLYKSMEELSKDIGKLKPTLKYLRLGLRLGGEIPEEIAELDAEIDLSGNSFTGKIPLFVRNCKYPINLRACQFTEMDWRLYTDKIGEVPILVNNYMTSDIPQDIQDEFEEVLNTNYLPQRPLPDFRTAD